MIERLKANKVGLIAAIAASIIDFCVLLPIGLYVIGFENGGETFFEVGSIIMALVAYLIGGGLKVALTALKTAWNIGTIIPIFPVDLICGILLSAIVLMVIWQFPIVAVLISCFVD